MATIEPEHPQGARSRTEAAAGRPLSDSELDRIPVVARSDVAGLSRAAKDAYASLRYFARGREHAFPAPSTLEGRMGVSADTRKRAVDELIEKKYIEDTGIRRGRQVIYRLLRGRSSGTPQTRGQSPQVAARDPQSAGHIEEVRTEESAPKALSLRSQKEAAASPRPADAGSAAAKKRRPRWPLSPQAAEDRDWLDNFEWTPELFDDYAARTHKLYERYSFGGEHPAPEPLGAGTCSSCRHDVPRLERYRDLELCRHCASARRRVATKIASQVVQAEEAAAR